MRRTKRTVEFVCILILMSAIATLTSGRLRDRPETEERWSTLYQKGTDYIYLGKPEMALEPLTEAAELAVRFQVGDRRLAETYDDLAHAYFLVKDFKQAQASQGKAVAALVLAGGPRADDLTLFVERFGTATHQTIDPDTFPAYTLVGTHTPYDGARLEEEIALLIEHYRRQGDLQAVEFLELL